MKKKRGIIIAAGYLITMLIIQLCSSLVLLPNYRAYYFLRTLSIQR